MADVIKINSGSDVKRTGGVYSTGASAAATDTRTYDTHTLLEGGAQNAGGNVPPAPPFSVIASGCIDGVGTNLSPLTVKLDPAGGISCTVDGLCVSGVSASDYFVGEYDNGNSGASKTIDFSLKANHKLTLTANAALTFSAPASARSTKIRFVQGGSGAYTPTASGLSGSIPTLASGVGQSTVVNFYYDGNGVFHV